MEKYPVFFDIAPGVKLCATDTKRFKTGCIGFTMLLPMKGNLAANALLPYILRRSCRKYPDFSLLNGRLAELYGASLSAGVSKFGERQFLSVSITAIDDRFSLTGESIAAECAALLLDLIFDPDTDNASFKTEAVELEKRLMIERIESELNNKRVYAFRRCQEHMFESEDYGKSKYGTIDEVKALSGTDVYNAWLNLLKTAVIQVDMAGSSPAEKIADELKKRFADIEREPASLDTLFINKVDKQRHFQEEMVVEQGKLVLGFRTDMTHARDNIHAMRVMTDIFGGGTYSKLFKNLREKMSLCYYCSARMTAEKGVIFVQSGIESDKDKEVITQVLRQLEDIKSGNISAEEFEASKLSICDSLRSVEDSPESIVSWYAYQIIRDEITTPAQEEEMIKAVNIQEVIQAAKGVVLDTSYFLKGIREGKTDED